MSYSELVYRLGKRYSAARQLVPENAYPFFSGTIEELIGPNDLELQGEKIIAYNGGQGTRHLIRVYFEGGTYEAQGTPPDGMEFGLNVSGGVGDE